MARIRTRAWRALATFTVLLTAVAVISGAHPAAAGAPQRTRPPASQLQQMLDRIVAAGAPGAVGLVWDGRTTERAASGVADLRTGRPMRTADRYRVGSVTKTFVAAVVLQLVGEGVLWLSDPIERWLPGLVPGGAGITVLSPSWAGAAGAIVSTVEDVARFYRALLGGHLLRPDLLAAMKTTVDAGSGFRYGLGLINGDAPCATIWGHNGDFLGYFDFAITNDRVDRQVVLMMNLDDEVNVPPAVDEAFTTALLGSFCPA